MSVETFTSKMGGNIRESMGGGSGSSANLPKPPAASSQYQGIARPKEALTVPLDRIIPDPNQPRQHFDPNDLADLSASLKARGQLQPIRIRWSADDDRWVIVAGERRHRAAKMAGMTSLLCIEAKGEMTPDEILEDQLIENCIRVDLKPLEQAKAFRSLIVARGLSNRQLAETLNISHTAVNRALALLELPEPVQQKVEDGKLAASVGQAIAANIADPETQEAVAKRIVSEDMSREEAKEVIQQAKDREPRPAASKPTATRKAKSPKVKPLPTSRTIRVDGGFKVTVEGRKGLDSAKLLAVLREVTAKVEAEVGEKEESGQVAA